MKRQKKIEAGVKFGRLKIIYLAMWHRDIFCICQCECLQIVKVTGNDLETTARTACLNCEEKKELKRFKTNDVCLYCNNIGEIPFGEQVIVTGYTENSLEIEYRGRLYECRPSELEKIGINFYDRRQVKKIR